jgi:hypothetical protein
MAQSVSFDAQFVTYQYEDFVKLNLTPRLAIAFPLIQ